MIKKEMIITREYLRANPTHVFVFGDNKIHQGHGGAALLRDEPNTFGFCTKLRPDNNDSSFYKPEDYHLEYSHNITQLIQCIKRNPNHTFLISKLGAGLANKYGIWESILKPGLEHNLSSFGDNVILLWED